LGLRLRLGDEPYDKRAVFPGLDGDAIAWLEAGLLKPFSRQPNFGKDSPLEKIASGFDL
jgi:hypothetical protein